MVEEGERDVERRTGVVELLAAFSRVDSISPVAAALSVELSVPGAEALVVVDLSAGTSIPSSNRYFLMPILNSSGKLTCNNEKER